MSAEALQQARAALEASEAARTASESRVQQLEVRGHVLYHEWHLVHPSICSWIVPCSFCVRRCKSKGANCRTCMQAELAAVASQASESETTLTERETVVSELRRDLSDVQRAMRTTESQAERTARRLKEAQVGASACFQFERLLISVQALQVHLVVASAMSGQL